MLVDIVRSLKRSVVYIVQGNRTGTGFVIDKSGHVATCNHVVKDQTLPSVYPVSSAQGFIAQITRRQPQYDLAVLKVDAPNLEPVTFGSYQDADEGEEVAFCGYPFGRKILTTHKGIVSAKFEAGDDLEFFQGFDVHTKIFQLDASVNKGNSGGPLLSLRNGRVIGVINARFGGIREEWISKVGVAKGIVAGVRGGVRVDPFEELQNILRVMNETMQLGIGFAVSVEHLIL